MRLEAVGVTPFCVFVSVCHFANIAFLFIRGRKCPLLSGHAEVHIMYDGAYKRTSPRLSKICKTWDRNRGQESRVRHVE